MLQLTGGAWPTYPHAKVAADSIRGSPTRPAHGKGASADMNRTIPGSRLHRRLRHGRKLFNRNGLAQLSRFGPPSCVLNTGKAKRLHYKPSVSALKSPLCERRVDHARPSRELADGIVSFVPFALGAVGRHYRGRSLSSASTHSCVLAFRSR